MRSAGKARREHVVRRVVTGHDERGRSRVVSDDDADAIEYGGPDSVLFHVVWGRDDVAHFPDAGIQPRWSGGFPPPGGCRLVVFELPPGDKNDLDGYVAENLTEFADPARPGMHATPTTDFDIVLNGTVGLELDEGEGDPASGRRRRSERDSASLAQPRIDCGHDRRGHDRRAS